MTGDPVSWFMIEPGWIVLDAHGEEVGSVDEIAGDSSDDIFNGLSISTSLLGKPRYVPSEQVAGITEGRVRLKLSKDEVERLGELGAAYDRGDHARESRRPQAHGSRGRSADPFARRAAEHHDPGPPRVPPPARALAERRGKLASK